MAATIVCTNCGAKLTLKAAVAPGKKINCPKCKKAFVVEDDEEPEEQEIDETGDEEEETRPTKKSTKAAKKKTDEDDADDDEDEKPAKKKKSDPKKKSSVGLIVGVVGVLLLCCCGGTSGGAWYSWSSIQAWFGKSPVVIKDAGKNKDAIAADGKPKLDDVAKDKDKIAEKDKDKLKDKDKIKGPDLSKPDVVTTAEQFSAEFLKDFDAAYKKYNSKIIEFTGEATGMTMRRDVFNINKGRPILRVYITGQKGKNSLYLTVEPSDFPIAYQLAPGQKVKITARFVTYTGKEQLGFAEGKITELTKSNILAVTSEQLAAEFEKSPKDVAKKFTNVPILVAGEVVELKKLAVIGQEAKLKGNGKTSVRFYVSPDESGEKERLKVGAQVVVRVGTCKYEPSLNQVYLDLITVTSLDAANLTIKK